MLIISLDARPYYFLSRRLTAARYRHGQSAALPCRHRSPTLVPHAQLVLRRAHAMASTLRQPLLPPRRQPNAEASVTARY